ncbi:demethoxyubiquinone hydroxylase family protein [Reyranella sp. CPCC 100927]|uniref:demethoxyubiquinone hydroxylase family protein n=1 Tax=Reyranella sp. CPCC 100927 TaxID=2599616 RepID=UPI0011B482FD|nr:demethoxyubiquinone hydroxylase family protein [Reyranella sp. CPCC 100927]TWT15415.1 demethoxyubiquinone hydroxylase family protein [Reyranella sp. CPCC 100927]
MEARDQRTIARILKVNHAGEHGAIRIYRAQIWVARRLYPDLLPFLTETIGHEIEHCRLFLDAMPQRQARPCRFMGFWGSGGLILGVATALMTRQGIWICTAAIEAAVHRHLDDQLHFVRDRDVQLHALIESIRGEELQHLRTAQENIVARTRWTRFLTAIISWATDVVIWLSTSGDSRKMAQDLAAARLATG